LKGIRAVLVNGLFLIAAVIIGAALSEGALRLFHPQPLGVWHHDPNGLALHWPGLVTYLPQFGQTVAFNSVGMRDREHSVQKPSGVFRILVLGDSFMEALQVPYEASFPSLLERTLQQQRRTPIEVVNASVSGWGTDDQLQYLTTYGLQWHPDLILVAMTLHNDISDNLRERFHIAAGGRLIPRLGKPATFLEYKVVQLKSLLATRSHAFQLVARARRSGEMRRDAGQLNSHVADLFARESGHQIVRGFELTELLLDRIRVLAGSHGTRVVLVLLPLAVQLSDEKFSAFAEAATGSPGDLELTRPQRLMQEVARRAEIPVIDLLPGFRSWTQDRGDPLFLERDGHWNEDAHRLAAEIVVREILARGLAG
jgi:hypothetical protein